MLLASSRLDGRWPSWSFSSSSYSESEESELDPLLFLSLGFRSIEVASSSAGGEEWCERASGAAGFAPGDSGMAVVMRGRDGPFNSFDAGNRDCIGVC